MVTKGLDDIGDTRFEEIELDDLTPEINENMYRSHEEDTEEIEVYRHKDYDFPPSMPRPGFKIRANGRFIEYVPDELDRGVVRGRVGRWSAVGGNIVSVRFDEAEDDSYTLRIASVDEDMLRIRR